MYIIGYPLLALANILSMLLLLYTVLVIAAVIISFLRPDPYHPAVRIIRGLTEPLFARVRRYLPPTGPLDLSPLVVLIVLSFFQQGIVPIITNFAHSLLP